MELQRQEYPAMMVGVHDGMYTNKVDVRAGHLTAQCSGERTQRSVAAGHEAQCRCSGLASGECGLERNLNVGSSPKGQERRRIEEAYVQSLRKLARKQPPDESSNLGCVQDNVVQTCARR